MAKLEPIELDMNVRVTIVPVATPAKRYCPCNERCHTEDHPCSFDCLGHRDAGWMAAP